tara:strand:- start:63 stop:527 length:465 start_codon:yes stop_codon:yes gene_type:complete
MSSVRSSPNNNNNNKNNKVPSLQKLAYQSITRLPNSEITGHPIIKNSIILPIEIKMRRVLKKHSGRSPSDKFEIVNDHGNGWYTVQTDPRNYLRFIATYNGYAPFELKRPLPKDNNIQFRVRLNPKKPGRKSRGKAIRQQGSKIGNGLRGGGRK